MHTNTSANIIDILLVEDNPGDVRLIQELFKVNILYNKLHIVEDGVEAMDFLYRRNKYSTAPRPDLILLDLNLPRMDGKEILAKIKNDESLMLIPVIVLTTSEAEEDIIKSYKLHANCYITKPIKIDSFMKIITTIKEFWLTIVKLPPK